MGANPKLLIGFVVVPFNDESTATSLVEKYNNMKPESPKTAIHLDSSIGHLGVFGIPTEMLSSAVSTDNNAGRSFIKAILGDA